MTLDAALGYAGRGWAVIPCEPRGKLPLTEHGSRDATTDADTIRAWWLRWPAANVAIVTGAVSGLVVLDIDAREPKRGDVSLVELVRDRGPIPWTLEVLTGSGGAHYYFAIPAGLTLRNSASRIGPGIDSRGEGGFVIAPPSMHASGSRYSWIDDGAPLAELSGWLLEAMLGPSTAPVPPVGPPSAGRYGSDLESRVRRAVAYVDRMPDAVSGAGGHDTTWRVAIALVRGFELPGDVALEILAHYNTRCAPPWSARELAHKVRQACDLARVGAGYLGAA